MAEKEPSCKSTGGCNTGGEPVHGTWCCRSSSQKMREAGAGLHSGLGVLRSKPSLLRCCSLPAQAEAFCPATKETRDGLIRPWGGTSEKSGQFGTQARLGFQKGACQPACKGAPGRAVGKATARGGGEEGEALLRLFLPLLGGKAKLLPGSDERRPGVGDSPSRSRSPPGSPGCPPPPCLRRGSRRARLLTGWSRWPASCSTCSRSGTSCSTGTARTIAPAPAPSPSSACRLATASEVGTEEGPAAPQPPRSAGGRAPSSVPGGLQRCLGAALQPPRPTPGCHDSGTPPAMLFVSRGGVAVPPGAVVKGGRWGGNLPAMRAEEGELVK